MAGKVKVDGHLVDKAGYAVKSDQNIEIVGGDNPFVSRGGLKLQEAIHAYKLDVSGQTCLDVGASTGGFTDCLLQYGAKCVYAVDVGYGQLAWSLRQHNKVVVMERTNIRHLSPDALPAVDMITIDTSFISLKIVVPAALPFLKPGGRMLPLIKPQFEVGRQYVGKKGVVKDKAMHRKILNDLTAFFEKLNLQTTAPMPSPILGPKGNREFFIQLRKPQSAKHSS